MVSKLEQEVAIWLGKVEFYSRMFLSRGKASFTEIRQLTFGKLKALESGTSDATPTATAATTGSPAKTQQAIGDGTQVVFTSELMPTETLVKLQSKAPSDSKQRPLFVVHAIEGFVTALKPLAGKMTCPVYGLQCTADAPLNSLCNSYAIAGYS